MIVETKKNYIMSKVAHGENEVMVIYDCQNEKYIVSHDSMLFNDEVEKIWKSLGKP